MTAVAFTLGLLLALLVVLLAAPMIVEFSIHRIERTEGYVRFRWLFGLVRFRVVLPRPAKARGRPASAPKKKSKPPRRGKNKGRAGDMVSLVSQRDVRRRAYRFIRDMLRATNARDLLLRLRIGLGDPADTGRLWAVVGPLAAMGQNLNRVRVRIEPDFVDTALEVESHGRFRLVPIQFIAIATAFALSPTVLRAWWRVRRGTA
ncbi:MAG: DUF2953 domain-containing protein [Rhodospirillales bacterium]|nr:MAG: DUF2953 domain-containing protein [Rhodospirillales bacterium]